MSDTITVKEAAKLWGITERRVTVLCKEGRIKGAYKKSRSWVIPIDAEKPADSRIKTGAYRKTKTLPDLPLPVGISDYRLASSEYYYVDKTMMIRDFLDERPMVSVFTRPRRFGKTLNMDMIRTFFEKKDEDTSTHAGEDIYERLNALLQGESFLTYIDTGVIYPQIRNNPSSVYSFLLVAGYLKVVRVDPAFSGDYMCEVALPNREIALSAGCLAAGCKAP